MIPAYLKKINPADVASEFEKLRRQVIPEGKNNSTAPAVRATLANVIFLVGDEDIEKLIYQLGKSLPSRFFTVKLDSELKEPLDVRVASIPIENSSGQILQTEEVYIAVQPNAVNRVPNILLAQLVPDIDVVVVECSGFGRDVKSHVLRDLIINFANIYVSEDSSDVAKVSSAINPACAFRSWTLPLIAKWCSLISEQFDSDYVLSSLKNLREVQIDFSVPGRTSIKPELNIENFKQELPADVVSLVNWISRSLTLNAESIVSQNSTELILKSVPQSTEYLSTAVNLRLRLREFSNSDLTSHVLAVSFIMGEDSTRYQVSCQYLKDSNVVEVSCGGTIKSPGEKDDFCEFNVRRIPAHNIDTAEALLIAIRNQPYSCSVLQ